MTNIIVKKCCNYTAIWASLFDNIINELFCIYILCFDYLQRPYVDEKGKKSSFYKEIYCELSNTIECIVDIKRILVFW